jgi:hypothetical protein
MGNFWKSDETACVSCINQNINGVGATMVYKEGTQDQYYVKFTGPCSVVVCTILSHYLIVSHSVLIEVTIYCVH